MYGFIYILLDINKMKCVDIFEENENILLFSYIAGKCFLSVRDFIFLGRGRR